MPCMITSLNDKVSSQDFGDKTKKAIAERALQELQTGGYSVKTTIIMQFIMR